MKQEQEINGLRYFVDNNGVAFFSAEHVCQKLFKSNQKFVGKKLYKWPKMSLLGKLIGKKNIKKEDVISEDELVLACLNTQSKFNYNFRNWVVLTLLPAIKEEPSDKINKIKDLEAELCRSNNLIDSLKDDLDKIPPEKQLRWTENFRRTNIFNKNWRRSKKLPKYKASTQTGGVLINYSLFVDEKTDHRQANFSIGKNVYTAVAKIDSTLPNKTVEILGIKVGYDFETNEAVFYKKELV